MGYRVVGLSAEPFQHLYGLSDEDLARHGGRRYVVDKKPGFPDRIEVRDLEPGEHALLINFTHQPANNPYHASHAIFVGEGAHKTYSQVDVIPPVMRARLMSVRAFNAEDEMIDADVVDGENLEPVIARFFASREISYLHAHYAQRGCYAARIERA